MLSPFALAPHWLSLILLIPAAVSFWLAAETFRPKYASLGRRLSLLTFSLGWWCLTYALELASVYEEGMRFWLRVEYVTIPLVAPLMYIVVRQFVGMPLMRRPLWVALWVVPALTLLFQTTNDYHHLFYQSVELVPYADGERLSLVAGPWYHIYTGFVLVLGLAAASHLILRFPPRGESTLRFQFLVVLAAVLSPYLGFILYLGDWFWIPDVDLTPYFFSVSGLLLAVGILRLRLFDLLPIALERVFEKIGDACLVFDSGGRLIKANGSAKKLLGWVDLPLGESQEDLLGGQPELARALELTDGESARISVRKGSEEHYWWVSRSNIEDARHYRKGYLLVVRDETEQTRMERKLRDLNAEKDKILSIIGHDLRGSLSGMESLSDILSEDDTNLESGETRDLLKTMKESAAATSRFLENLLLWARMQRGEHRSDSTQFTVGETVQSVLSHLAANLESKNIEVEEATVREIQIITDRTLIELVLRNLLSNAIKFSKRGATIWVRAEGDGVGWVRFEVSDGGIGMSAEALEALWSLSAKVGRPGTEGEPSSGLGLILVREALDSLGGRIEVESEKGKGTTFRFWIPQTDQTS